MSSGKIAVVSSASKLGGTELSALRICNLLKNKGHEVVYIAPGSILQDEMQGIKLLTYSISRKNPLILAMSLYQIARILRSENVAVAHCQDALSCILVCYAKKIFKCKVRIIWHERGIHFKSYRTMSIRYSPLIDVIVCNSNFERTLLLMNRCNPQKIRVIYNAIEQQNPTLSKDEIRENLNLEKNDYVVGMVGRISYEKDINTVIKATSLAIHSINNLKLLIVGDGPEKESAERLAQKLGIADKIVFAGFRRDISNMMCAMDLFVLSSLHESFGNVTVEAMLSKVPVVVSKSGGIPEVVQDKINGLLVTAGEEKSWCEAMVFSAQNPEYMKQLAEKAYKDANERYNFEKFYSMIVDAYYGELRE